MCNPSKPPRTPGPVLAWKLNPVVAEDHRRGLNRARAHDYWGTGHALAKPDGVSSHWMRTFRGSECAF